MRCFLTTPPPPARPKMSAAAPKAVKFTSAFRLAGLNYLQALNAQTVALRKVLKEPLRTERMGKASFRFREFTYIDGKESAPGKPSPCATRCACGVLPVPPSTRDSTRPQSHLAMQPNISVTPQRRRSRRRCPRRQAARGTRGVRAARISVADHKNYLHHCRAEAGRQTVRQPPVVDVVLNLEAR